MCFPCIFGNHSTVKYVFEDDCLCNENMNRQPMSKTTQSCIETAKIIALASRIFVPFLINNRPFRFKTSD